MNPSLPKGGKKRLLTGRDSRSGNALYYVELEGQAELRAALDRFDVAAIRASKAVIAESAQDIVREAQMRAPVRATVPDYPISAAKAGEAPGSNIRNRIRAKFRDAGLTAVIGAFTDVARFVEFGTRKMSSRPFLGPAFEVVRSKFVQRLQQALNRAGKQAESKAAA